MTYNLVNLGFNPIMKHNNKMNVNINRMINKIQILGILLLMSVTGCSDDQNNVLVEINLDKTDVFLLPGQSLEVKITEGNGGYEAESVNEAVATASVSGNSIRITAADIDRATTSIVVTDGKFKRAMINVVVEKEFDLILNRNSLSLELGIMDKDEATVVIEKGNFNYTVKPLDEADDFIIVNTDNLEKGMSFSVKAKAMPTEGKKVQIEVKDAKEKRSIVEISIIAPNMLSVDSYSLTFDTPQVLREIEVKEGVEPFFVDIEDPSIAEIRIVGKTVKVISRSKGSTSFIIRDKFGYSTDPVSVVVDAPNYALSLGASYFCHTSFQDLATVDMSIKSLQATTWEMVCKIDGYRGLQTFMGLEGKLIIRGKNDDYHDKHPIEIAGLGDRIMLLTKESFDLNKWMHIALVVDCSKSVTTDKYKFYINGEEAELEVNRDEETHRSIDMTSSADDNRFEIGLAAKQNWRAMRGTVSEVRIWKTPRTLEQIRSNMCSFQDVTDDGLLVRWNFSVGVETDFIQDSSGNPYPVNLTISKVVPDNGDQFFPSKVPTSLYVENGCVE